MGLGVSNQSHTLPGCPSFHGLCMPLEEQVARTHEQCLDSCTQHRGLLLEVESSKPNPSKGLLVARRGRGGGQGALPGQIVDALPCIL